MISPLMAALPAMPDENLPRKKEKADVKEIQQDD
jgi:hypothetical protein